MSNHQYPIQDGLFTWPSVEPVLLGSLCQSCKENFFPVQKSCSNCSSTNLETIELGREGILWTWTIQEFMPKEPYCSDETQETFSPYGVGYIEMTCGVKVESRLKENNSERLKIGMKMKLVIEKFRTDSDGKDVMTFAFQAVN